MYLSWSILKPETLVTSEISFHKRRCQQEECVRKDEKDQYSSALYGGQNTCISTHQFTSVFNYTVDQPGQSVVSSDPLNVCLCTEMNEVNCNMSKHFTSTIPGRQYSIPVCTVGNMDGLTPARTGSEHL